MAYRLLGGLLNMHFVGTSWCSFFLEKLGTLFDRSSGDHPQVVWSNLGIWKFCLMEIGF